MVIESYSFGCIKIDGKTYTQDIIIYPGKVSSGWWRKEGHSLCLEDIEGVLGQGPEWLIIGCGASGVMQVPKAVIRDIESRGIKVLILNTEEACKQYNRLSKTSKVIACLHLTC
jgi:hypothetical protein